MSSSRLLIGFVAIFLILGHTTWRLCRRVIV